MLAALVLSILCDLIVLKDGRVWTGEVIEEQADRVKVRMAKGAIWVARADIVRIESVATQREEYKSRAAKAASADDHRALALWCRERALAEEEKAEWVAVAAADPANEEAHKALGHVQVDGKWMTAEEAIKAQGLVDRKGEWVTPKRGAVLDLLDKVASEDLIERAEAKKALKRLGEDGQAELQKLADEAHARLAAALAKDGAVNGALQDRAKAVRGLLTALVADEQRLPSKGASDAALAQARGWVDELARIGTDPAGAFVDMDAGLARDAKRLAMADAALGAADRGAALEAAFREKAGAEAVFRAIDPFKSLRAKADDANKAVEMSADERGLLDGINLYRMRCGRAPLRWDDKLAACARQHSEEMKRLDYMSHTSPVAKYATLTNRAALVKFKSKWVGENLARGEDPPADILRAFQDSPGHHRNLVFADYSRVGVAKEGEYWTVNFGADPEE